MELEKNKYQEKRFASTVAYFARVNYIYYISKTFTIFLVKSKIQYKDLIKTQEELNNYDYRKMMNDFETETRHKKVINGIRNKWRIESNKYHEKIKNIKIENRKSVQKKQRDYKKRFKAKELSIKNQLELNKLGKIEEKNKRAEFFKRKNEGVEKNLEIFHRKLEEERLKVEENTMKKSN